METMFVSNARQFKELYQELVMAMNGVFQRTRFAHKVPTEAVIGLLDKMEALANSIGVLSQMKNVVNSKAEYTYRHSVNVAVLSGLLGKWLGLERSVIRDLMLAGALHDIGKSQVALEILNKPGDLTSFEMQDMKQHTVLGYQLLKDCDTLPRLLKLWILQHHERLDGSGYPYAYQGNKVSYHAQIIAVADIYDAMTSSRVYRDADTPLKVISELSAEMFGKLDPGICKVFLEKLAESLIGNSVRLNNGTEAEIIFWDTRLGNMKPVVKTADGEYIDLEKAHELNIIQVIPS
ncbi:MAG: rpfG 3 [Sporomusa sp.]|nr:rpfG 3 [Sporomusa sp.]